MRVAQDKLPKHISTVTSAVVATVATLDTKALPSLTIPKCQRRKKECYTAVRCVHPTGLAVIPILTNIPRDGSAATSQTKSVSFLIASLMRDSR